MISTAINAAADRLTSLGVIDRYGGLSIPVTFVEQIDDKRTVRKMFPVREGVDARDCYQRGKYQDLIPDDRYKNLVYWEELSGLTETTPPSTFRLPQTHAYLTGSARLVYWLNLPKMGKNSDVYRTVGDQFAWTLIEALDKSIPAPAGFFDGAIAIFENARQLVRDVGIFTKYSYDLETVSKYVLYPYDFGAIDFDVSLVVPRRCFTALTLETEISCVTDW